MTTVVLAPRVGDMIIEGDPLLSLHGGRPPGPDDREDLCRAVEVSVDRTLEQDFTYGVRQLVDIALRALSPGIQDPTTAHEALVEANLDDMSPQHFGSLERALVQAGAVDVWSEAVVMKKGRLGTRVSAIVAESAVDAAAQAFMLHSTTLGVRVMPVRRIRAERHIEEVDTIFGKVRVKRSIRGGPADTVMPEHDDCERLAEAAGVPVRAVWEAALVAAKKTG